MIRKLKNQMIRAFSVHFHHWMFPDVSRCIQFGQLFGNYCSYTDVQCLILIDQEICSRSWLPTCGLCSRGRDPGSLTTSTA